MKQVNQWLPTWKASFSDGNVKKSTSSYELKQRYTMHAKTYRLIICPCGGFTQFWFSLISFVNFFSMSSNRLFPWTLRELSSDSRLKKVSWEDYVPFSCYDGRLCSKLSSTNAYTLNVVVFSWQFFKVPRRWNVVLISYYNGISFALKLKVYYI